MKEYVCLFFGFVLFHALILYYGSPPIIDVESLEYGEFAAAFYYKIARLSDINDFFFVSREGSLLLLPILIVPFFKVLGPSYFALHFSGVVFSSIFTMAWYGVFRKALPEIPKKWLAVFFIISIPFIQTSSIYISSIMTHLGASTVFAFLILIVLGLKNEKTVQEILKLILVAFIICVGLFYSKMTVVFIPSIFYIMAKKSNQNIKVFLFFLLLLSPIALMNFPLYKDILDNTTLDWSLAKQITSVLKNMNYILSIGRYDGFKFEQFPITILYILIAFIVTLVIKKRSRLDALSMAKRNVDQSTLKNIFIALVLSSFTTVFLIIATGLAPWMKVESFTGMRYLTPVVPLIFFIILVPVIYLNKNQQRTYIWVFVILNLGGAIWRGYPLRENRFMLDTKGYIGAFPLYMEEIDPKLVFNSTIANDLAPWYGMREYSLGIPKKEKSGENSGESFDEQRLVNLGRGLKENLKGQCFLRERGCKDKEGDHIVGRLLVSLCMNEKEKLKNHARIIRDTKLLICPHGKVIRKLEGLKPSLFAAHLEKLKNVDECFKRPINPYLASCRQSFRKKEKFEINMGNGWFDYLDAYPGKYTLTKSKIIQGWKELLGIK